MSKVNTDVIINKGELYKIKNLNNKEKVRSFFYQRQKETYDLALKEVEPLIRHHFIDEEEVEAFVEVIESNIINNLLGLGGNMRVNEKYLEEMIKKENKYQRMKKKKKC